ncbi:hypothetical protein [Bacillus manliponensis]|uniref:Uncharacterized protein n=1 Tax=Bacillus manliponensis TaxID=574376 RepID=A0A073K0S8_9BACI|nr:hypothetical protein [Bacillus manliponensis]KEK20042.1 hypothetical protein BAMA_20010 [Bacillus manliponensis]
MKKTCIVCGGDDFISSTLYARTKQEMSYAPNMYRFEKVFMQERDEENYPIFQEIIGYHCRECGHVMLFHA